MHDTRSTIEGTKENKTKKDSNSSVKFFKNY